MRKEEIDFTVSDIFRTAVPEALTKNKCTDITEFLKKGENIALLTVGMFPDGRRILIDGYEYYDYICEHPDVEFQVTAKGFPDTRSAVCYVLENFYNNNTLTKIQQKLIIYMLYELQKKGHGGARRDKKTGQFVNNNGSPLAHGVADVLGRNIGGFTYATVQRAEEVVRGLNIADKAMPGVKDDILLGNIKMPESVIREFADMYDDEIVNTIHEYEQRKRTENRIGLSGKTRKAVYERGNGCCYICGEPLPDKGFIVEHKIPLANGGTNDISNLYCSCELCNKTKGTRDFDAFVNHAIKITDYQRAQKRAKIS